MNIVKLSFEHPSGRSAVQVFIPDDWQIDHSGLFVTFHSPGGWILEMVPVVRVLHPQTKAQLNLLEAGGHTSNLAALCVEGLRWEWLELECEPFPEHLTRRQKGNGVA